MDNILKFLQSLTPVGLALIASALVLIIVAFVFFRIPVPIKEHKKTEAIADTPAQTEPPTIIVILVEKGYQKSGEIKVIDESGKSALIEVAIISKDFAWQLGKHNVVERFGKPVEIKNHLSSRGISKEIKRYNSIIAVGAASNENADLFPEEESSRADKRAAQIQLWIREHVGKPKETFELSLGYNKRHVSVSKSARQRQLVIIGVVRKDEGFDFQSSLRKKLDDVKAFPFKLDDYSKFDLKKVI